MTNYPSPMPMTQGRELPSFTLRQIDFPEVITWEINGEYFLVMKVKMTAKRNRNDIIAPEDKEKLEGEFQIMGVKALGDKPVNGRMLEQEDLAAQKAKVLSGEYNK